MAQYIIDGQTLSDIGDAIRDKLDMSLSMYPETMPSYIRSIGRDGEASYNAPDDIVQEAYRVASSIISKRAANSITFVAMSDMHEFGDSDHSNSDIIETYRRANLNAGQAAKIISDKVGLDFYANLGDFAWGSSATTIDDGVQSIRQAREYIAEVVRDNESFITPGNHDSLASSYNSNGTCLSYSVLTGLTGDYRYVDFEDRKVRVICLNTADNEGSVTAKERVSGVQLQWFAESLDLSSKSDVEDWGIIVLAHHPLDWGAIKVCANCLAAYLEGGTYSLTHEGVAVSYDYSGKNGATFIAQFHGHVHGFRVDFINDLRTGSPVPIAAKRIAIPNACFGRNNEYGENGTLDTNNIEFGEDTSYDKTDNNTANNTAFCAVSVDLTNKVIYADCFGCGYDRVISYNDKPIVVYSVTNYLSHCTTTNGSASVVGGSGYSASIEPEDGYIVDSIVVIMNGVDVTSTAVSGTTITINDVTGAIEITATADVDQSASTGNLATLAEAQDSTDPYNGVGYRDDTRLSQSGTFEVSEEGYVVTGWIPYSVPNSGLPPTIYVSGAELDLSSSNSRIQIYRTKYDICNLYMYGYTENESGLLTTYYNYEITGENSFKLTPIADSSGNWTGLTYNSSLDSNWAGLGEYIRISLIGSGKKVSIVLEGNESTIKPSSYINIITEVGYTDEYRLSTSTGELKPQAGYTTTGLMDLSHIEGDITVKTSGVDFNANSKGYSSIVSYQADGTTKSSLDYLKPTPQQTSLIVGGWQKSFDDSGNLTLIVPNGAIKRFRLCGYGSGANLIVAVNID